MLKRSEAPAIMNLKDFAEGTAEIEAGSKGTDPLHEAQTVVRLFVGVNDLPLARGPDRGANTRKADFAGTRSAVDHALNHSDDHPCVYLPGALRVFQ